MSTVHKTFTVVTFILSVAFLVATGLLFSSIENFKEALEDTKLELKNTKIKKDAIIKDKDTEINELNSTLVIRDDKIRADGNKIENIENTLQSQKVQIEDYKKDLSNLEESVDELTRVTEKQSEDLRIKDERIASLESDLTVARKKKEALDDQVVELMDKNTRMGEQLDSLNKEHQVVSKDLEEKNMVLAKLVEHGIPVADIFMSGGPPKPIHGKVLAVNPDVNLVVLSVGERDGVKTGYQFVVYRGDSYVGKVQVEKVMPDMASARILKDITKADIIGGDNVSTDIYR